MDEGVPSHWVVLSGLPLVAGVIRGVHGWGWCKLDSPLPQKSPLFISMKCDGRRVQIPSVTWFPPLPLLLHQVTSSGLLFPLLSEQESSECRVLGKTSDLGSWTGFLFRVVTVWHRMRGTKLVFMFLDRQLAFMQRACIWLDRGD